MWSQAQHNNMTLLPLDGNGWLRVSDEELAIDWDSQDNIQQVRDRVSLLLKGCGCKSGCKTNRCSCRKKEKCCGPGCRCNCENSIHPQPEENRDISHIMHIEEIIQDEHEVTVNLEDDIDGIMESIFGIEELAEEDGEDGNESDTDDTD